MTGGFQQPGGSRVQVPYRPSPSVPKVDEGSQLATFAVAVRSAWAVQRFKSSTAHAKPTHQEGQGDRSGNQPRTPTSHAPGEASGHDRTDDEDGRRADPR